MFQKLNMFQIRFHINFKILPMLVSSEKTSVWYLWRLSSIEPENRNQDQAHCVLKKCSRHHHQYSLAFQKFNLSCLSKKWPVFWPFLSIKSRIASRRYMSCFTCLLLLLANNRISNFVIRCNLLFVIYKYKHNWRYCTRNSVLQKYSSKWTTKFVKNTICIFLMTKLKTLPDHKSQFPGF